ncbi:MAG TPA: Vms1/Ankzf1 family peptidyl-tRNA hydrolase [Solirubrobacteraceae bacterium]|nr:Vms1/Ankzf1 family peptidyl-tRNA hydrolase [Solirubrobacteraceae bacterium]
MNTVVQAARRLVEHRPGRRVLSLYLDLDPERFATAPARASQVRSLVDEAAKEIENTREFGREDRLGLREDLERVKDYLLSREPPFQGARGLAVFCCGRDDLFETVRLPRSVPGRVVLDSTPYVEPMLAAAMQREWCVVLVSRRRARVLTGMADELRESHAREDEVHGQHDQGGWSQANYERSVEKEVDDHLRAVAELIERNLRRDRFDRLALGGPPEIVPRLEGMLSEEVLARLAPERVEVDVSSAGEAEIRAAVAQLVEKDDGRREREALDRLAAGLGSGGRAAAGPEDTVEALNERRVETLLLAPGFDREAARCQGCGMIVLDADGRCPADGGELQHTAHLREAAVECALAQDAEVMIIRRYQDLGPFQGIGALLRF